MFYGLIPCVKAKEAIYSTIKRTEIDNIDESRLRMFNALPVRPRKEKGVG
jgi:hypothetical protein